MRPKRDSSRRTTAYFRQYGVSTSCTRSVHMRQSGLRDQLWVALGKILRWGEPCQGLVWAEGVVEALPGMQGWPHRGEIQVAVIALPELLGMGALGALHMAVEFGRAGREDEEAETCLSARLLEVGHELTPTVHL